jgi:DeoR family myo-inositol catabolism operon transcriptional repressor
VIIQRHIKIIEYIKQKGTATLDELCNEFEVSKNTIRRDVNELEEKGVLKKVYGGVIFNDKESVVPLNVRQTVLTVEKERIGREAARLVNDNDIIIIDSGSTTVHMVKHLKNKQNVTIITNSISVVNEAYEYKNLNVILTGGILLRETSSVVGLDSVENIRKLNAKTAFIAATGVSISKGLTNSSMFESEVKKSMVESADKIVLMVDSTKFNAVSLVTFLELNRVNVIITDKEVEEEYKIYFEKNNINLIVAE